MHYKCTLIDKTRDYQNRSKTGSFLNDYGHKRQEFNVVFYC